jgi:hypothetical protein
VRWRARSKNTLPKQLQAELVLQALHALGERGLAHAEALRGAPHVLVLGHGDEVAQIVHSHR